MYNINGKQMFTLPIFKTDVQCTPTTSIHMYAVLHVKFEMNNNKITEINKEIEKK